MKLRSLRNNGFVEKPVNVGQHLRNRRLILGQTQQQVAAQLSTVREVYERWERCEHEPVVSVWPAIIAFLGYYPHNGLKTPGAVALMARRCTGLDRKKLANKLGIDHQKLSEWEHEEEQPSEDQLHKLKKIAKGVVQISTPAAAAV